MHANNEHIELDAIEKPDMTFTDHLQPLEAGLEHEKYVTSLINGIYAAAEEAHDYRTMQFLQWFIQEQGEEEENAQDMIAKMKLFGGDAKALYDLDQEYAGRAYTQASPLTTA
jgi:ferritin